MSKRSARLQRQRYIQANRRRHRGAECQFCGTRWRKAKTNFYVEKSSSCQQCMCYLATVCRRGAAWIAQRRDTLRIWDLRLDTAQSGKRRSKLRLVVNR